MPRVRKNRIHICLTDDELEHVNELVKISGINREQYTRMLYRKVIPRPCPSTELLETINQLRRIGTNINQIAYIANATDNINKDYFTSCYEELQDQILNIKNIMLSSTPLVIDDGNN